MSSLERKTETTLPLNNGLPRMMSSQQELFEPTLFFLITFTTTYAHTRHTHRTAVLQ